MATIVATAMGTGKKLVTETTLTGTDDIFSYARGGQSSILILRNPTAGTLTPIIDGDGATTVSVPGVGSVDISGGYAVGDIDQDEVVAIALDTINAYLSGDIAITGGTGLVAQLLTF